MFTVEECLRFAEQCERSAYKTTASRRRETLLAVARAWRELAEERKQPRREAAD